MPLVCTGNIQIFCQLHNIVLSPLETLISASGTAAAMVMPLVILGFTIQIMWKGYEIISGKDGGSNHLLELFMTTGKNAVVVSVGLTAALYQDWILSFIATTNDSPGELAQMLLNIFGFSALAPAKELDRFFDQTIELFNRISIFSKDNLSIIPFDLRGLATMFFNILYLILMGAYLLLAFIDIAGLNLAICVSLGLGPLFIACYPFEATRKYFDGWLLSILKPAVTMFILLLMINLAIQQVATFSQEMWNIIENAPRECRGNFLGLCTGGNHHTDDAVNNVIMGTIKLILYALVLSGLLMKTNYIVTDWLGNFNQYTSNTANAPKNAMAAGSTALSYAAGAARGAVGMAQGGMKSGGSGGARKGGSGTPGTRGISEAERMNTILK